MSAPRTINRLSTLPHRDVRVSYHRCACGVSIPKCRTQCVTCRGEATPRQIEVMQAVWKNGNRKEGASELGISLKSVEDCMKKLRDRWKQDSDIGIFKVALRRGLITFALALALSANAMPWWKKKPPPQPPPGNYSTNAYCWWGTVPSASVYQLSCWPTTGGVTNFVMTFGTNAVVSGLTNSVNYSVAVRCAQGTNSPWSAYSCQVNFTAGGASAYCPSTTPMADTTPTLNTSTQ